jgi:hypothetical protein
MGSIKTIQVGKAVERTTKTGTPILVVSPAGGGEDLFFFKMADKGIFTPGAMVEIECDANRPRTIVAAHVVAGGAPSAPAAVPPVVATPSAGRDGSIESQVAVKELGECLRSGTVNIPADLVEKYWAWLRKRV